MPLEVELKEGEIKRPELKYLDSKIKRLEADLKMQNAEQYAER